MFNDYTVLIICDDCIIVYPVVSTEDTLKADVIDVLKEVEETEVIQKFDVFEGLVEDHFDEAEAIPLDFS